MWSHQISCMFKDCSFYKKGILTNATLKQFCSCFKKINISDHFPVTFSHFFQRVLIIPSYNLSDFENEKEVRIVTIEMNMQELIETIFLLNNTSLFQNTQGIW